MLRLVVDLFPRTAPPPSPSPLPAPLRHDAGDDVCGICRASFDACPPEAKYPGDDCPVVWGVCSHAFHIQCINK